MISRFHHRFFPLYLVLTAFGSAQPPTALPSQQGQQSNKELGGLQADVYRNPFFGFTYKLPYGWVDRTSDMREGNDSDKLLLLAAFERPPQASGSTINSAVVIAAEKVSAFSAVKTASDYFGPITELATAQGFSVVNEPHDFPVGIKHLVRGDFSKPRGSLTMLQTSLVAVEKGYAVSFTFIAGSTDETDELIERLRFSGKQ